MLKEIIVTDSYFDGERLHDNGPYTVVIDNGSIASVSQGRSPSDTFTADVRETNFLMPGMVEGHCHLFLKGEELNFKKRSSYLKEADINEMMDVARENLRKNIASGITLVRDAGDIHGINTAIRAESRTTDEVWPAIHAAGIAIRKRKRYGSFMATDVETEEDIVKTAEDLSSAADQLKVLMTGIIDFENGEVKGSPQFTVEEASLITETAKRLGKLTFAHCSGLEGLEVCVESGMDSIEHGFFMNRDILNRMKDKNIAWVPTYAPVDIQWQRPELCGWNEETVGKLREILDNHLEHMIYANEIGVNLVAGSDAGSYGVEHGTSLIDEVITMVACGISTEDALAAATTVPRVLWGCESAAIKPGNKADMVLLDKSPFDDISNLRTVAAVRTSNGWYAKAGAMAAV